MKSHHAFWSKKSIFLLLPLFAFWLILSPSVSLEAVIVGLIVCLGVVVYSSDISFDEKEMPLYIPRKLVQFIIFTGRLLLEIVKANIDVAKIVLNPSLPISPNFVWIPVTFKNDVNKVIYGNAVTLTPGTLTVDVKEDGFVIHALTKEAAQDLQGSIIEQYVMKLEEDLG